MTKRPRPAAGQAARQAIDGIAALLDACGHPDGARLRDALAALDQLAPHVAGIVKDPDPAAALLEALAARQRRRLK